MSTLDPIPPVLPATVEWADGRVRLLDQTQLPQRVAFVESDDPAVLAAHHERPFIVAAPWSSVDRATPDGASIPIEQRAAAEITQIGADMLAPAGVAVCNPAVDITPQALVSAIVTERGLHRPPYDVSLSAAANLEAALA